MLTPAGADEITWAGGTDGDWHTADNWDGGMTPGDEDTAVFYSEGAANLGVTLSASATIDGLSFNAGATEPVTIHVTGVNPLTLDGGASMDLSVLAGAHTIEGAGNGSGEPPELIATGGQQTWHVADGASLAIDARLRGQPCPSNTRYNKTGAGTLALGGDNGGSGGWGFGGAFGCSAGRFVIEQGTLRLTHPNAAGNSFNPFTVTDGTTLELTDGATRYGATNGILSLAGQGVGGVGALYVDRPGEETNISNGNGQIFLARHAAIGVGADSTLRVSQNITATGLGASLTKVGPGTLILRSDENTYGGNGSGTTTTIQDGTLILDAEGALRMRLLDNGVGHSFTGTGALQLDGLLRIDASRVNDEFGAWNLVRVDTLDVSWGETFGLAFLDEQAPPFVDRGGGVFTSGTWIFEQATGILRSAIPGDFDGDGDVDAFDLGVWQSGFGTTSGATIADGDADNDGDVDAFDLGIWQANFGTGVGSATVPEPATLALLVPAVLWRRRARG